MRQEYLIEQLGKDGRWFIFGSDQSNGWAQVAMRGYRRLFPKETFRVVEYPSQRLVVCEGGPALGAED